MHELRSPRFGVSDMKPRCHCVSRPLAQIVNSFRNITIISVVIKLVPSDYILIMKMLMMMIIISQMMLTQYSISSTNGVVSTRNPHRTFKYHRTSVSMLTITLWTAIGRLHFLTWLIVKSLHFGLSAYLDQSSTIDFGLSMYLDHT